MHQISKKTIKCKGVIHGCNQKLSRGGLPFLGGRPLAWTLFTKNNTCKGKFKFQGGLNTPCPRGEYFTKFPDNHWGKVSSEDQVLGKSLLI